MAGDPAELAYGHALAMLGDPDAAADVAALALRRAGRARGQVLAHARQESVARAIRDEPVDIDSLQTVVLDLPALAATLASTRPPEERAALDVRARTGGDLAALGEALGMRPSDANDKCAELAELWERTLDPALLAFSGAGECTALGAILEEAAPDTVAKLLTVAPAVHTHATDCVICTDRIRAMASVRSFFSDAAIEAPGALRAESHRNRTKRPSAAAAPLFPSVSHSAHRYRRPVLVAAVVIALVAVPMAIDAWSAKDNRDLTTSLTKVIPAAGLRIDGDPSTGLILRNDSSKSVHYTISTSAPWLTVAPSQGRLAAHVSLPMQAVLSDDAPEGAAPAMIIVHTSTGATTSQSFMWHNERPPELATTLDGCSVGVTVVDDGDLANLELHWRDTTEHVLDIAKSDDNYNAELRPDNGPVTYWVTATDTRGNTARTADGLIQPGAC